MLLLRRLQVLWRNLVRTRKVDDDLAAEIASYQQLLEDEKRSAGLDPQSARREALLEIGGATQIQEQVRELRLGATLQSIAAEIRQSVRGLRRNPGLTILGTLMLALGIGASTVVFSIFYAALLQPLPFRDPARLLSLNETRHARGIDVAAFTLANFWDVREQNHSFDNMAAYHTNVANLTGTGTAERVSASIVTTNFFRTLGVSPIEGRDFPQDDDPAGAASQVVIVGNRFWHSHFGGDSGVLGRTLRLSGTPYTVIGVLPPGDPWIDDQLYLAMTRRPDADRSSFEFEVIGRLAPGASVESARADLERVAAGLAQSYPREDKGIGFRMDSSSTWVAGDSTRRALWVLLGAVTFLMLIACLNIANLLLARGMARQREIAVRTALGAGRARLIRFVMMEALLLSGFGCLLGLALAYGALGAIQTLEISGIPRLSNAGMNPWVLAYAVLIALLTGVLSGLAPALHAPVSRIAAALRDGDRQTGSRGQGRLRAALVTGEVALSFLLLVGAGLLIRSFHQLMNVDRGFQTENRLLFSVNLPASYYDHGASKQFVDRFFEQLSAAPQVIAVGGVGNRPLEAGDPGMAIDSVDHPQAIAPWASWRIVSPGYLGAVGLPLLRGRNFDQNDKPVWQERGQPAPIRRVMLSERLAKLILPNSDPIGRRVSLWKGQSGREAEVIGVVADSRERSLASGPALTVYIPYGANAPVTEFVVHTAGNPLALVPAVRSILAGLDPDLPLADIRSFEDVVSRSVAPQRFNAILLGVFSGLALLLATTGLYGVLSYSMSRRTSEIGLRVALGASGRSILAMTLGQGMRPAFLGIGLGVLGAWWLSRYFETLLFAVKPFDLATYAVVAALLLITAAFACYVPGRRAMRTDPAIALRTD